MRVWLWQRGQHHLLGVCSVREKGGEGSERGQVEAGTQDSVISGELEMKFFQSQKQRCQESSDNGQDLEDFSSRE